MNHKVILSENGSLDKSKVQTILVMLATAWVLPFLIHLLPPYQGIPMGAFLLPMFYIPFIALFFFRLPLSLAVAAFAPILNFLISGNPNWEFLTIIGMELMLFSVFAFLLLQTKWRIVAAPLGYVFAKIISSSLLIFIPLLQVTPMDFFRNSITNAAPGIIILLIINWILVKKLKR